MVKRKRLEDECPAPVHKKRRLQYNYDLSLLSDELVLKTLTYLAVSDLATCQRLSRRLRRLAGDSQIWKQKYYARWVRPRALRIPGLRETAASDAFRYSSKLARWLNDGHLVQQGHKTDWRLQYRLRDNWWRGHCKIRELEVADPPAPPVLVKIHRGITLTADTKSGLRAWTTKSTQSMITSLPFTYQSDHHASGGENCPTSLGVDTRASPVITIYVGFRDGSFAVYWLDGHNLSLRYRHSRSSNGALVAITAFHTNTLTMSEKGILSMYRFTGKMEESKALPDPQLLVSLQSSHVFMPVSLSIRPALGNLVATIAYPFSRLGCGWCLGLQELRLTEDGETLDSRMTSSIEGNGTSFRSFKHQDASIAARSAVSQPFVLHPQAMARPTSISYSHPYLLASLPDNTLMTHLVTSNVDKLEITPGRRLWGHTSSVSGVQVSDRGKAVSVSTRGGEIRVWELEDLLSSSWQQQQQQRRISVCIKPDKQDLDILSDAINRRGDGLGLAQQEVLDAERRSWVGFDEEQVVVLGEHSRRQILSCYDFT